MSRRMVYLLSFVLTLVLAGSLTAQGVDPGTDNLTHSWTFDDGTANDMVGTAHGTLIGDGFITDGTYVTDEIGQWIEMDGEAIALYLYDDISIEAWFTPAELMNTGFTMLWYFGDAVDPAGGDVTLGSYGCFYSPARGDDVSRVAISCGVQADPWNNETGVTGPEVDDGVLHHMVGTINNDEIAYYLDGELQATAPMDAHNSIEDLSPNFAWLCRGGYSADPSFLGELHECNIYNKILSADEVTFLYLNDPWTAVEENAVSALPKEYNLSQNYPNPFNPNTNISFDLVQSSEVNITVYDVHGKEIVELMNEVKSAGRHNIQFNGESLSSGVYLCRMVIGDQVFTRRMMLLK